MHYFIAEMNTPHSLTLRKIPPEVYKFLLLEQSKEKNARGIGMYSLESTVYKIIKDYMRCREKEDNK